MSDFSFCLATGKGVSHSVEMKTHPCFSDPDLSLEIENEIYPQPPHGIRPYTTKTENKKIEFLGNRVFSVT